MKIRLLILLFFPTIINAQKWVTYTTANGLGDNTINDIVVDSQNNKWFGTEDGGVTKYNNDIWVTYNTSNGLPNNKVRTIFIDNKGVKWFGTMGGGVAKFDDNTWKTYNTTSGLASNYINDIAVDSKNNLWFATDVGITKFNGSSWVNYTNSVFTNEGAYATALAIDANDNIWVGTSNGLYKFTGTIWISVISDPITISDIVIDTKGTIWTNKSGASKYNGLGWTTYTESDGLVSSIIRDIAIQPDNTVWFGTWDGVSKFDGNTWTTYTKANGLVGNTVLSIAFDSQNNVWFGTREQGVSKFEAAYIRFSPDIIYLPEAANSSSSFVINSNTPWSITSSQEWLSLSQTSGSDNSVVTVTALKNHTTSPRTASVSISGPNITTQTVTVTQEAGLPFLDLSGNSFILPDVANSHCDFEVLSNTNWVITSDNDWLMLNPTEGRDNSSVTISASVNNTGSVRTGSVVVSGNGLDAKQISVFQRTLLPQTLAFSTNELQLNGTEKNSASVGVLSNTIWQVETQADWISVDKTSGFNNDDIVITVLENLTVSSRTATVTLSGEGVEPVTLVVNQNEGRPILAASSQSIRIGRSANSQNSFFLSSNTSWNLSSSESWLAVNPKASSGSKTISLTAQKNPLVTERNAIISITNQYGLEETVNVIQEAGLPSLSVSTTFLNLESANNSQNTFEITSNTNWSISSNQSWFLVDKITGSENATVTIVGQENPTINVRNAVLSIYVNNVKYATISVSQLAGSAFLSVSTNELSIGDPIYYQNSFEIFSNISWTAYSSESWLTLEPKSGSNNAVIQLLATENSTQETRSANILILADGFYKSINIKQSQINTDIGNVVDLDISFLPNPVKNEMHVSLAESLIGADIYIYSLNGTQLYYLNNCPRNCFIDLSGYSSGIYLIKLMAKDGAVYSRKVMKQ